MQAAGINVACGLHVETWSSEEQSLVVGLPRCLIKHRVQPSTAKIGVNRPVAQSPPPTPPRGAKIKLAIFRGLLAGRRPNNFKLNSAGGGKFLEIWVLEKLQYLKKLST